MENDYIVTLGIAIAAFIIGEFVFHRVFTIKKVSHRHIYALLITVLSSITGLSFKIILETRSTTTTIGEVIGVSTQSTVGEYFSQIVTGYHRGFRSHKHSRFLEPWAQIALKQLSTEMTNRSITLPALSATDVMYDLYKAASHHIIQTHIGALDVYTRDDLYIRAIREAARRNIPVIRIYLFEGEYVTSPRDVVSVSSGDTPIEERFISTSGQRLSEYNQQVRILHGRTDVLMSVVIPVQESDTLERRELLVVDDLFFAETKYHSGTTNATGAVQATANADEIRRAYKFLNSILGRGVPDELVHLMEDNSVRSRFSVYFIADHEETERPARVIARELVEQAR